tara:strand:- start:2165 stop:2422 length:258 start_codon:yes stop_codon:yes gene_type:complete
MSNEEKTMSEEQKKTEHIQKYIKSMRACEDAMEPYKEQKRTLKSNYVENGWLTKEEISMAVKAYRLLKDKTDLEQLLDFVEVLSE